MRKLQGVALWDLQKSRFGQGLALKSAAKPMDFTFSLKNLVFYETKWLLRRCFCPRGLKKTQKVMNCQQKSRFSLYSKGVQKTETPKATKRAPREAKMSPRSCSGGPKSGRGPKTAPRAARSAPRGAQEQPGAHQKGPKRGPREAPGAHFGLIFGGPWASCSSN